MSDNQKPAPTPEAADTAPALKPAPKPEDGDSSAHWDFCVRIIDGTKPCSCLPPYARNRPAPASPDEAPADLREAVDKAFSAGIEFALAKPERDEAWAKERKDLIVAALVHPQAPKAAPPQPQAQPSEAHACPFCKHTLKSRDGFYTCSNRACSFPLGIAPTPTAGAPTLAAGGAL